MKTVLRIACLCTLTALLPPSALVAGPDAAPKCPEALAALLPASAANATGVYDTKGGTAMGVAEADLPFDFACPPTSAYPAKLKLSYQLCGEKASPACLSQLDLLEKQSIVKDKAAMVKARDGVRMVAGITEVKEEQVAGGTAIYFVSTERCWAAGAGAVPSDLPYMPTISFKWYFRSGGAAVTLTITGNMTPEKAKELATEVSGKFTGKL